MSSFRTRRWPVKTAILAALALTIVLGSPAISAWIGGWINPTNFPVIDTDVTFNLLTDQPAASQIDALTAHQTATGAGVVVAVLDGGFNLSHPMIAGNLHPLAYDAIDNDGDPEDSGNGIDDDGNGSIDPAVGHGTFAAGMVILSAPEATIMPVRVVDDEGYGTSWQIASGVFFAVAQGAHVINLSLKVWDEDGLVKAALLYAWLEGVTVVVAGGNDGILDDGGLETLADEPYVIGVGAVDAVDKVATFTSLPEDDWLEIYAPGVDLWGPYGFPTDDTVAWWSGTSFSAGLVSGGAALLLETDPGTGPMAVKFAIWSSGDVVYRQDGTTLWHGSRLDLGNLVD